MTLDLINSRKWTTIQNELDMFGTAVLGALLSAEQCTSLIQGYDDDEIYRSRIVMAQHGFGKGEYKYFNYPLPKLIAELRKSLYPPLAGIANRWNEQMGVDASTCVTRPTTNRTSQSATVPVRPNRYY